MASTYSDLHTEKSLPEEVVYMMQQNASAAPVNCILSCVIVRILLSLLDCGFVLFCVHGVVF